MMQLFWSPSAAFADLGSRPGYIVSWCFASVASIAGGFLADRLVMTEWLGEAGVTGASQSAAVIEMAQRFQMLVLGILPAILILKWLAVAGLLSLTTASLGGLMEFRSAFCLVACAEVVNLLRTTASMLIVFARGTHTLRSPDDLNPPIGLDLFVGELREPLRTLAGVVNPFELWYLVILVIGVRLLNRLTPLRAMAAVGLAWGVTVGLRVALQLYLQG